MPRFPFSDFPLGNSAGKPHDRQSQALTPELALRVPETAPVAQTIAQSQPRWSADASWQRDRSNIDPKRRGAGAAAAQVGCPRRKSHADCAKARRKVLEIKPLSAIIGLR
jgi:hypothetical protein